MGSEAHLVWEHDAESYSTALAKGRKALAAFSESNLTREAIFLSNPTVDTHMGSYLASLTGTRRIRKDRRREGTLIRYAQRFCAKNDTTSFFGATSVGRFDQVASDAPNLPIADVRRLHVEHWVMDVFLSCAEEALATPPTDLPVGLVDPLGYVQSILKAHPPSDIRTEWLDRSMLLKTYLDDFKAADLSDRRRLFKALESYIHLWLSVDARRGAGEFYASRTVLHETADRSGEVIGLEADTTRLIQEAVPPLLELSALVTTVERLKYAAFFETHFGAGPVAFSDVTKALKTKEMAYHLGAPDEAKAIYASLNELKADLRAEIDAHVSHHGLNVPLSLNGARLAQVLDQWRSVLDANGVAYSNPDVMLNPCSEGGHVVLGDVHGMPYLTPAAYAAAPSEEEVWRETARCLAQHCAPAMPAIPVLKRRSFIAYEPDLEWFGLEVDAIGSMPPERRGPMAGLKIARVNGAFRFWARNHDGEEIEVLPLTRSANLVSRFTDHVQKASPFYPVRALELGSWLVAPGWRRIEELPRLLWGNAMLHRRTWRVASAHWTHAAEPHIAFGHLRSATRGELPRFTFMVTADHPKPILVDWANPVSAEYAYRVARREESLQFTEMLPGPEALWLQGPQGGYTSELRTVFFRTGTPK
jgi:hypothetical protein